MLVGLTQKVSGDTSIKQDPISGSPLINLHRDKLDPKLERPPEFTSSGLPQSSAPHSGQSSQLLVPRTAEILSFLRNYQKRPKFAAHSKSRASVRERYEWNV